MKHKKSVSLFRLYPACGLWTARGQDKLKTAHTFSETMMHAHGTIVESNQRTALLCFALDLLLNCPDSQARGES